MKTSDSAAKGLVFVVDDNDMLVEFATTLIESLGYEVRQFSDPKEVLLALCEPNPKPALLVTDYEMGQINGLQLIQSAHKIHPSLKTLMLSGTVDSSIVLTHTAKVDRFLGKPYEPAELQKTVKELMRP